MARPVTGDTNDFSRNTLQITFSAIRQFAESFFERVGLGSPENIPAELFGLYLRRGHRKSTFAGSTRVALFSASLSGTGAVHGAHCYIALAFAYQRLFAAQAQYHHSRIEAHSSGITIPFLACGSSALFELYDARSRCFRRTFQRRAAHESKIKEPFFCSLSFSFFDSRSLPRGHFRYGKSFPDVLRS